MIKDKLSLLKEFSDFLLNDTPGQCQDFTEKRRERDVNLRTCQQSHLPHQHIVSITKCIRTFKAIQKVYQTIINFCSPKLDLLVPDLPESCLDETAVFQTNSYQDCFKDIFDLGVCFRGSVDEVARLFI